MQNYESSYDLSLVSGICDDREGDYSELELHKDVVIDVATKFKHLNM